MLVMDPNTSGSCTVSLDAFLKVSSQMDFLHICGVQQLHTSFCLQYLCFRGQMFQISL